MPYVAMTLAEERENLRNIVAMLNDASERLQDWQGKSWSHDDAVWLRRVVRARRGMERARREDREKLRRFTQKIGVMADGTVADYYAGDAAAMNFWRLLRNSQRAKLRRPCLTCDQWYLSKTNRRTEFCSRRCAGNAVQARKRKREHDRKIKKAQSAIRNYPGRPARFSEMDWKQFVSEATGISKKFLTVAVRSGELRVPPD